jgi:S-DNA-T family DNA segregation ATPase FtsK/SpoIIIE
MAKTAKSPATDKKKDSEAVEKKSFQVTRQHKMLFGALLVLISIAMLLSFISFFIYGQEDQSAVDALTDRSQATQNWLGKFGAALANFFIYRGFGAASFIFVKLFFLTGAFLVLDVSLRKLKSIWFWDLFIVVLLSVLFGFFADSLPVLGGVVGYEMNLFLQDYLGKTGTMLLLVFGIVIYLIFKIKISPDTIKSFFERTKRQVNDDLASVRPLATGEPGNEYNLEEYAINEEGKLPHEIFDEDEDIPEPELKPVSKFEIDRESLKPTIGHASEINLDLKQAVIPTTPPTPIPVEHPKQIIHTSDDAFVIEKAEEEDIVEENLAAKLVEDFGLFDPKLDLSNYKFPTLDLLKEYSSGGITINQEELEENKNTIVETLRNYKIEIAQIKATVGPSVTLYEIVPEAGIRISKIKSLEDDIALSLSALGIRIIAPIPGKGTIGIEVPNKKPDDGFNEKRHRLDQVPGSRNGIADCPW